MEVSALSSRILLVPLCGSAQSDYPPPSKALEAVLLNTGHEIACLERKHVSDELLENSNAVFLEVIREDHLAFLRELRARTRKPVLIYGAGVPKSVQIEGLDAGADGFLRIPASLELLQARVHAFLRRSGLEPFRRDTREGAK